VGVAASKVSKKGAEAAGAVVNAPVTVPVLNTAAAGSAFLSEIAATLGYDKLASFFTTTSNFTWPTGPAIAQKQYGFGQHGDSGPYRIATISSNAGGVGAGLAAIFDTFTGNTNFANAAGYLWMFGAGASGVKALMDIGQDVRDFRKYGLADQKTWLNLASHIVAMGAAVPNGVGGYQSLWNEKPPYHLPGGIWTQAELANSISYSLAAWANSIDRPEPEQAKQDRPSAEIEEARPQQAPGASAPILPLSDMETWYDAV